VRLADQRADGAVEVDLAGGVAVDAHLVLERAAEDAVALAQLPSALTRNLGTTNSEMPLLPAGASGRRASTRCTMFSARSCSPAEMKIFCR
jgi:hypothetical protein